MKLESVWESLIEKHPQWAKDGANLTAKGLRALVEATFKAGYNQGIEDANVVERVKALNETFGDRMARIMGLDK